MTIDGGGKVRLFALTANASLTLNDLTLLGGLATGGAGSGGGGGGLGAGGAVFDDGGSVRPRATRSPTTPPRAAPAPAAPRAAAADSAAVPGPRPGPTGVSAAA